MGRSAGPGHPLSLRCAKCKLGGHRHREGYDLEATGRTRKTTRPGRSGGIRSMRMMLAEYRCLTCGHVGWTRHSEAERLLRAHAAGEKLR